MRILGRINKGMNESLNQCFLPKWEVLRLRHTQCGQLSGEI